jgi:surfeit locus 1 family protein
VHLLTPFVLTGTDTAVIVDRGWVPQTEADTDDLAKYNAADDQALSGFVALTQPLPRSGNAAAQPAGPQTEVYRVDVARLQAQLPYELLPFYVLQAPDGDELPPFQAEPEIDLTEGPHLSYAIQWVLFSVVVVVGYILLLNKSVKKDGATAVAESDEEMSISSSQQAD